MLDCSKCLVNGFKCSKYSASCKATKEIADFSMHKFAEWLQENVCISDGVTFLELLSIFESEVK